ncbi:hypothetical protein AAAC51_27855 [Priestia megaterium]
MTEVIKAVELSEKSCWRPIAQRLPKTLPPRCASATRRKIPLRKPEEQAGTRVEEFTNKPKKMVKKYDGLIYSPSISSGVSIEQKHFDRHFGMFCGEVVPSDAIQMLRRDRTAKEFIIGFDKVRARRKPIRKN